MTLADVTAHISSTPLQIGKETVTVYKSTHRFTSADTAVSPAIEKSGTCDTSKRIFATPTLDSLIRQSSFSEEEKKYCLNNDFAFYASGWQSWGFGGEVGQGSYPAKYIPLFPQFNKYITMPGGAPVTVTGKKEKLLEGQFIVYFRWNNCYLVIASTGNYSLAKNALRKRDDASILPPVEFTINRKERILSCSVNATGKSWQQDELIAELSIFSAHSFFDLRDIIAKLYAFQNETRLSSYQELSITANKIITGGWESWYNHYSDINSALIQKDLAALSENDNIVKTFIMPKTKNTVFQIDDGWEQGLGQWEVNSARFPEGMNALASSISSQNYIPGLWIAPFVIDWRTDFCTFHKDMILCDEKGKPVEAGFSLFWGAFGGKRQPCRPYSFFCLDLSNETVIKYLDALMEKIINEWGFRYIKLDFLYAGMLNGTFKNGGSTYLWYNRALKVLTSRTKNKKGEAVVYLGCGMPFESSASYLPLSRIGPDTKEDWDMNLLKKLHFSGRPGAFCNLQSTLGHAFWDQSIFINDPDVIFLRDTNSSLTHNEKELIALVNFLFAGQIMISDDMTETATSLTKEIVCLFEKLIAEKFGQVNLTDEVYVIFNRTGTYCGLINLSKKEIAVPLVEFNDILKKQTTSDYKKSATAQGSGFEPVIAHGAVTSDFITTQPHSISIYSRNYYGR